jgi:Icc-related predicted phosphoesterase
MKIQYVADIHANHPLNHLRFQKMIRNEHNAEVLVVAGDISDGLFHDKDNPDGAIGGYEAMAYFKKNWKHVVHCWGNHDFWYGRLPSRYAGHTRDLGNLRFISTPLFSLLDKKTEQYQNRAIHKFPDLRLIHSENGPGITCAEYNHYALRCRAYLEKQLVQLPADRRAVVVTHHLPLMRCIAEEYRSSDYNTFFANDLEDLIQKHHPKIAAWIHGHAHEPQERQVHGVKIVRNPLGYLQHGEGGNYANRILEI